MLNETIWFSKPKVVGKCGKYNHIFLPKDMSGKIVVGIVVMDNGISQEKIEVKETNVFSSVPSDDFLCSRYLLTSDELKELKENIEIRIELDKSVSLEWIDKYEKEYLHE